MSVMYFIILRCDCLSFCALMAFDYYLWFTFSVKTPKISLSRIFGCLSHIRLEMKHQKRHQMNDHFMSPELDFYVARERERERERDFNLIMIDHESESQLLIHKFFYLEVNQLKNHSHVIIIPEK